METRRKIFGDPPHPGIVPRHAPPGWRAAPRFARARLIFLWVLKVFKPPAGRFKNTAIYIYVLKISVSLVNSENRIA